MPLRPDVLVLHPAQLSSAVETSALAADLGLEPDRLLVFEQAFSQSTQGVRSALSALSGDVALNLDRELGDDALARALQAAGWRTLLVGPPELIAVAGAGFDGAVVDDGDGAPELLAQALAASRQPVFAFVHRAGGAPLHADTTDATELQRRYAGRLAGLHAWIARCSHAFLRGRPQLLVVLGAGGVELGEHPAEPGLPWDPQVRVPFVLGLRGASGLPTGVRDAAVQSADMAPTLLDFFDLPFRGGADGASLEPLAHGWTSKRPHEQLLLVAPGHVALRTERWKLVVPVDAPWQVREGQARLYALDEDPSESRPLPGEPGPVAGGMLDALRRRLARPERGS